MKAWHVIAAGVAFGISIIVVACGDSDTTAATGASGAGGAAPPAKQACLDFCHLYTESCPFAFDCGWYCDKNFTDSGTECQDELETLDKCWYTEFAKTKNCGIINSFTICEDKQAAYSNCLFTYECADNGCKEGLPFDGGAPTDAGTFCYCSKWCKTVLYKQRCEWNGTAFDCNCIQEDASAGTCEIQGDPVCATAESSYCCDALFNL